MRQESQTWNRIRAMVEIVEEGAGVTGLAPTVAILRVSDGLWYQNGVGFQASFTTCTMTAVDATNLPGLYQYAPNTNHLDHDAGLQGYQFKIVESTKTLLEYVFVMPERRSPWDDLLASHQTADTMGEALTVAKALSQGNQRLKNPTYDPDNRLLTVEIVAYKNGADAAADTNAIATFEVTNTYDMDGNLESSVIEEV